MFLGFGSQAGQGQGSYIKFNPTNTGMDTMIKNGVSSQVNTRHQTITLMKEYENKSMEVRYRFKGDESFDETFNFITSCLIFVGNSL